MGWHGIFALWLLLMLPGLFAYAIGTSRVLRRADRWNRATSKEDIEALLPPGHRYDPATRLCYPPEGEGLPYHRGEMVVY